MKKNHNIAGNEPCATEICEELKQIFIQLRASAWAEKSAEDHETKAQVYRERQDVVQKMRGLRQHMETIQFREKAFLLYCIDLMEDVLAKGDREVLETVADCMHNMPEVGMAEPKYRDLSTFGEEVRQIRSVYNGQCFVGYVDRLMQPIPKKKSFLPDLCCCVVAITVIAGLVLWAVNTFAQRKIDREVVTSYGEAFVKYIFAGDFAAADACMEMKETADVQMLFDIAEEKWGLDFQSGMCVQGISSYTDSLSDAQWGVPAAYFTVVLTEGERPVSVQLNVIERENVFSVTYITIRCGVETLGYGGNEDAEDFRSEAFVSHETEEFL